MTPDEISELKELVEFLRKNEINEFEFEKDDQKIRLKFAQPGQISAIDLARLGQLVPGPHMTVAPASQHSPASESAPPARAEEPAEESLHIVKSPIVGTFYESSSPGAAPFVKIGDHIEAGQVLCIVEAMKLMNEIESDAGGEVVQRLVTNGQPVEYGQKLFALRLR
jgi:acetyl-CoA carboxylase biotin carboxyl carrier protein